MATIDYKQKIKDYMNSSEVDTLYKSMLNNLFPELVEPEDKRMWKLIKKYAHCNISDMALNADHITKEQLEAWLEKQAEQKLVEDRYMEGYLNGINDASKTIKPDAWSEEDKEIIDYLIDYLKSELDSSYTDLDKETFTKEINLLKSLKERVQPQSTWKPSEEQMDAIRYVSNFDYGGHKAALVSLYEQLKKLRGE